VTPTPCLAPSPWSAVTCRRFRPARHVAPQRRGDSLSPFGFRSLTPRNRQDCAAISHQLKTPSTSVRRTGCQDGQDGSTRARARYVFSDAKGVLHISPGQRPGLMANTTASAEGAIHRPGLTGSNRSIPDRPLIEFQLVLAPEVVLLLLQAIGPPSQAPTRKWNPSQKEANEAKRTLSECLNKSLGNARRLLLRRD